MLSTPFRTTTAESVVPGVVVEHDGQSFVVDEVRRNLEGIDVMGWPQHFPKRGRRVRVFVKPDDVVKLLATDAEQVVIADVLCAEIEQPRQGRLLIVHHGDTVRVAVHVHPDDTETLWEMDFDLPTEPE